MPKISENKYEVPQPDGSFETTKIKLSYNITDKKFEMTLPEHIAKALGLPQAVARTTEKETVKAIEKKMREYEGQLKIEPERFMVIDAHAAFRVPGKNNRIDWPNSYFYRDDNESAGKLDFEIKTRRGQTWLNAEEEKDCYFNPEETDRLVIPWTQEREDALRRIQADLDGALYKLFRFFAGVRKDPDLLLTPHVVASAVRKTVPISKES